MRINFDGLLSYCKSFAGNRDVVFLLDECQLYSEALMEKIRLLSDTRAIKFVITLHKTDNEDIIAKEHFKTRIWELWELKILILVGLDLFQGLYYQERRFITIKGVWWKGFPIIGFTGIRLGSRFIITSITPKGRQFWEGEGTKI